MEMIKPTACQAWWLISQLSRLKQEDYLWFEVTIGYIVSSILGYPERVSISYPLDRI